MILLVWTEYQFKNDKQDSNTTDHYEAFETLIEAKERYDSLMHIDDIRSASICTVVESSDYESNSGIFEGELDLINQFHTFEWENRNFGDWLKAEGYTQKQIDAIAHGDKEVS